MKTDYFNSSGIAGVTSSAEIDAVIRILRLLSITLWRCMRCF